MYLYTSIDALLELEYTKAVALHCGRWYMGQALANEVTHLRINQPQC